MKIFQNGIFDAIAIECFSSSGTRQSKTYGEVFNNAAKIAARLSRDFSDRLIGIQSENTPELLEFLIAIWITKKYAVLFHPRFPDTHRETLSKYVGCDIVFDKRKLIDYVEQCRTKKDNDSSALDVLKTLEFDTHDIASIVFTSGSTGRPKAIAHSFRNHFFSALGAQENTPFRRGDKWAASLPMCHVGGLALFFRALLHGGTIVFPPERLDFAESIVMTRATHLSLVPTQLQRMIEKKEVFLQELKLILIGGAPLSDVLFRQCEKLNIPIRLTYGMTESASQLCTGKPKVQNCGRPLKYRKLKIENNVIFIGGEVVFEGYVREQKLERRTNEWFNTGDLGFLDERGNLHIIGRTDNMFISGGENIQPEFIENLVIELGIGSEAIVVPIDDTIYGQRPFLFVNSDTNIEAVNEALAGRLAKFARPIMVSKFPKKTKFKRSREELKNLAEKLREDLF